MPVCLFVPLTAVSRSAYELTIEGCDKLEHVEACVLKSSSTRRLGSKVVSRGMELARQGCKTSAITDKLRKEFGLTIP